MLIVALLGMIAIIPKLAIVSDRDVSSPLLNISSSKQIIFFGFSTCSAVCPLTLATLARLDNEILENEVQVIFVEIDRHEENSLADQYAKNFNQHFIGIAPSEKQLNKLSQQFMLNIQKSGESILHQGGLYLVSNHDNQQTLYRTYNVLSFSLDEITRDIRSES